MAPPGKQTQHATNSMESTDAGAADFEGVNNAEQKMTEDDWVLYGELDKLNRQFDSKMSDKWFGILSTIYRDPAGDGWWKDAARCVNFSKKLNKKALFVTPGKSPKRLTRVYEELEQKCQSVLNTIRLSFKGINEDNPGWGGEHIVMNYVQHDGLSWISTLRQFHKHFVLKHMHKLHEYANQKKTNEMMGGVWDMFS